MTRIKKGKIRILHSKFRFSIFNDTSHEELFVFRAKGLMFVLSICLAIIFIIASVTILISYTPLREFIPGYPNAQTRKLLVQNALKIDSLERALKLSEYQITNIQKIVTGQKPEEMELAVKPATSADTTVINSKKVREDSLLRIEVLKQEQLNPTKRKGIEQIEGLHFFPPVKGIISNGFNAALNHPYLDIATPANSVVCAVLDGTVIQANWNDETGYVIEIQHSNDLVSIYKHNSKLLKKVGDKVTAGTAIALTGSTGSLSTGTHLHFELWHKGTAIDPSKYIKF
jgi:murein DD-endopeptidase MepM/ murein hydrolase activator NlpD